MALDEKASAQILSERALRRATEAPCIPGNTLSLLCDGPEVFPAWLADIDAAKHFVLFENYIFNNDRIGNRIADALIGKARQGVRVCLLYDWVGCIGTSRGLWQRLAQGQVEVRAFNPPNLFDPMGSVRRNHRKSLCIDGRIGYVGGLCVGDAWAGDAELGVPPWRDTALRIEGPAARALCHAFDDTWSQCGPPLPAECLPRSSPDEAAALAAATEPQGAPVRLISGLPWRSRIYRITHVLLSTAVASIWITDAYFLTPPTIYEALTAAAKDGVDVRVLLPGRSDLPWISWLGRAGYTGLLQAGVRIFEWDGPMLHAKTAVIDGRWCRVGSSNMNLSSFLANWELDVIVDDPAFASVMEGIFLRDLGHASELVLRRPRARYRLGLRRSGREEPPRGEGSGPAREERTGVVAPLARDGAAQSQQKSARARARRARHALHPPLHRAGAVVARASAAVLGAALRRPFEPSAWSVSGVSALMLLGIGALGAIRPAMLGLFLSILCLWFGSAALWHAASQWLRLLRRAQRRRSERSTRSGRYPLKARERSEGRALPPEDPSGP